MEFKHSLFLYFFIMIKFEALDNLFRRIEALDESKLWFDSVTVNVQDEIIRLNTRIQLGEDGIDSLGESLGEYAPLTIDIRTNEGLQVSFVDFRFTGWYWSTWEIEVNARDITINVDDERFNELVNDLLFSEDHVGLTEENMVIIQNMILINYNENIKRRLFS